MAHNAALCFMAVKAPVGVGGKRVNRKAVFALLLMRDIKYTLARLLFALAYNTRVG